jgi:hypothetical protein
MYRKKKYPKPIQSKKKPTPKLQKPKKQKRDKKIFV